MGRCRPPPLDLQALTPGPAWPLRSALPSSSFPWSSVASGIPYASLEVPPTLPQLPATESTEEKGQDHPSSGAGKESRGFGRGEGCEVVGSGAATAETRSGHHGLAGQLDEDIAARHHRLSSGRGIPRKQVWLPRRGPQRLHSFPSFPPYHCSRKCPASPKSGIPPPSSPLNLPQKQPPGARHAKSRLPTATRKMGTWFLGSGRSKVKHLGSEGGKMEGERKEGEKEGRG